MGSVLSCSRKQEIKNLYNEIQENEKEIRKLQEVIERNNQVNNQNWERLLEKLDTISMRTVGPPSSYRSEGDPYLYTERKLVEGVKEGQCLPDIIQHESGSHPPLMISVQSSHELMSEEVNAPTLRNEEVNAPTWKNEELNGPTLMSEEVNTSTLRSEEVNTPTLRTEEVNAPTLTCEEANAATWMEKNAFQASLGPQYGGESYPMINNDSQPKGKPDCRCCPRAEPGRFSILNGSCSQFNKILRENPSLLSYIDGNNQTIIHFAVINGFEGLLKEIIKTKPGLLLVNKTDVWGKTALHWASELRFDTIIKILLQHGASKYLHDGHGKTAADVYGRVLGDGSKGHIQCM